MFLLCFLQFPAYLNGSPKEDSFYLHVIQSTPEFEEPKDSRELALYKLLKKKDGFAFLTQKPLPPLCKFPMFMTAGEVATTIDVNYAVIKLNSTLFEEVKR